MISHEDVLCDTLLKRESISDIFLWAFGKLEAGAGGVFWKKLFKPATLLKRDSNTGFYKWILQNF